MNTKLSGIITKPHLFIQTQFSSEEQSDKISHFNHFQFEPKDAVSQIGNYNNYQGQISQDEIIETQINHHQNYNNIIQGLVHLEQIMKSWEINVLYDYFQIIKSLDSPSLQQFYYDRSCHKELLPNKSLINLRNNNHLLNQHHQRKVTSSSSNQKSLERAQVLNQIITKLHSRDKSLRGNQSYNSNNSQKQTSKKQIVKGKLQKLSNMLKGYKMQNEQSIKQSAILYTKNHNKTKQQSKMLDSGYTSKMQMSVFKKLKNEIMQVKSQVKQLKYINEVYRRQNYYLRNDRISEEHGKISKKEFQNLSTDRQRKFNNFNGMKKPNEGQAYLHHNYSQSFFMNNSPITSNPHVIPRTSHYVPSTQFIQRNYPQQHYKQISNNYSSRPNRCYDARHQNDWRTMVPDNLMSNSVINKIRTEPILFCYTCGCQCASNNEKFNITQRKMKRQSPPYYLNNII